MLRDSAMLMRLSISQWNGRKFDRTATREVEENHATKNIGRFNKTLVDPQLIKGVQQAANRIRTAHYARTMPWDDAEYRLLPSAMYFEHSQLMQQLESAYWREVQFVIDNYEDEIARSAARLGSLFDESEYPDAAELRRRYRVKWDVIPIPEGKDFRVDVGQEQVEQIRKQIEDRVAQASKAALTDVWERLADVVGRAHERLSTPDAIFRDTLIGNIEELCAMIPKLNFTGDADLDRMYQEVKDKLTGYAPQTLRDNQHARKEAADNARAILAEMDRFLGVRG